ncbi:hypothetical protein QQF64_036045 [Cirrhinus molitorella]|uniref:Uncharacterized protein n=1 Tax=Cirrhinus molitorella TaxID=172907 RepID=A0ABR3NHF7_9TELE
MWGPDEGFMGRKCGPHYGLAPGIHIGASRGSPDILKVGPFTPMPTWPMPVPYGAHVISSYGLPMWDSYCKTYMGPADFTQPKPMPTQFPWNP